MLKALAGAYRFSSFKAGRDPGQLDRLRRRDFRIRTIAGTPAAPPLSRDSPEAMLSLEQLERIHILRVLEATGGQKTKTSAILGINRTTLWKKLRH